MGMYGTGAYVRLEEKDVEVTLSALGRALPTLSFGFTKSARFWAFLREEEPMKSRSA